MGKWIFYQQCMCSRKNWTSTQMPVSPVTSATRTCIWHLWVASRLSSVPTNAILLVLFQCLIMHNFKFAKYNCTNNEAKIKSSRSSKIGHLQISWFRINPVTQPTASKHWRQKRCMTIAVKWLTDFRLLKRWQVFRPKENWWNNTLQQAFYMPYVDPARHVGRGQVSHFLFQGQGWERRWGSSGGSSPLGGLGQRCILEAPNGISWNLLGAPWNPPKHAADLPVCCSNNSVKALNGTHSADANHTNKKLC